jgi:hypothetical protein
MSEQNGTGAGVDGRPGPNFIRNMRGEWHEDRWPGESAEEYEASKASRGLSASPVNAHNEELRQRALALLESATRRLASPLDASGQPLPYPGERLPAALRKVATICFELETISASVRHGV